MRFFRCLLPAVLTATAALAMAACNAGQETRPYGVSMSGDPQHGREVMLAYGCGACHIIPGVHNARGLVGPPLMKFSRRTIIAGELPNTPANLVKWIENPRVVEPNTAMPDLGLTRSQASDAAAYLYTLR